MELAQVVTTTERFVNLLEPLLNEWQEVTSRYRAGMVTCQTSIMEECSNMLRMCLQKFKGLIKTRDDVLKQAEAFGIKVGSLGLLLKQITHPQGPQLLDRIAQAEARILDLRQQSWSLWVIANRNEYVLNSMIDMYSNDKSEVGLYETHVPTTQGGGLFLDASA
jgi:hypothetical protein